VDVVVLVRVLVDLLVLVLMFALVSGARQLALTRWV